MDRGVSRKKLWRPFSGGQVRRLRLLAAGVLCCVVALGAVAKAEAPTFTGSAHAIFGTPWPSWGPNIVYTGVGTNVFTTGDPAPGSSTNLFAFDGRSFSAGLNQPFPVSFLTYHNGETWSDSLVEMVPVTVALDFTSPDGVSRGFTFVFDFYFTPNDTGNPILDADIVTPLNVRSSTTFRVGSKVYTLKLLGFSYDGGVTYIDRFILPENATTHAHLMAEIVGLEGIELVSVTYTAPWKGSRRSRTMAYPTPGDRLVFRCEYRKPDPEEPVEVEAIHFTLTNGGYTHQFDATESRGIWKGEWTIPNDAPAGGYTLSATLDWRATDGSGDTGTDSEFEGRNFPGPGEKEFILYRVELEVAKAVLTLKHDNSSKLEVKVQPSGATASSYQIQIRRDQAGASWYTLASQRVLDPWQARIAGKFKLKASAVLGGATLQSSEKSVEVRFPAYADIVGDAAVQTATNNEWTNTLNDCTQNPNRRRERAFWIRLDTTGAGTYQFTTTLTGPWVAPNQGAYVVPGATPADTPTNPAPNAASATYTVALFHTHTPTEFRPPPGVRGVGPSGSDITFHNQRGIAGVVYDYTQSPPGSGTIPMGHPETSAAQLYHCGPTRRDTP